MFSRFQSLAVSVVTCAVLVTGCGMATQSPPGHDDRLTKAAGIARLSLVLPESLWKQTCPEDLEKVTSLPLPGERGERGLVRVDLSGTQLVSYLKRLDKHAHAGWGGPKYDDKAASRRVYDALAPAVGRIKQARSADDPDPEVLIDDTLATNAP
ncbi:hypothetical protein GCM10027168_43910 [Streptomyces capparidis]